MESRGASETPVTPVTPDSTPENVVKTNSRGDGQNIKARQSNGTMEANRRSNSDDEATRKKSAAMTTTTYRQGSQTEIKVGIRGN